MKQELSFQNNIRQFDSGKNQAVNQLNEQAEGSDLGKLTAKFEKDRTSEAQFSLGDPIRASDGTSSQMDVNQRMSVVLKAHPQFNSKLA